MTTPPSPGSAPEGRAAPGPAARAAVGVAWAVVGLLGLVVVATVVVPRLAGAQTYTILTSSMEPSMPPGSVVVVRPTSMDDVVIGDVVTYQLESGESLTVTHRAVGLTVGPRGDKQLVTKGDANDVADVEPVRAVQLRGTVWYDVPLVGRAAAALGADTRTLVSRVAALGLFAYAGWVLLGRRRPRGSDPGAPAHPDAPTGSASHPVPLQRRGEAATVPSVPHGGDVP